MSESNPSILLVDDDPDLLEVMSLLLRSLPYELHQVTNTKDALKYLLDTKPSLILLDLQLENSSGYDLLQYCRNEPQLSVTPIIIISSHDAQTEYPMCLINGADDYIQKPIDGKTFTLKVASQLQINRVNLYNAEVNRFRNLNIHNNNGYLEIDNDSKILWMNQWCIDLLLSQSLKEKNLREYLMKANFEVRYSDIATHLFSSTENDPFYLVQKNPVSEKRYMHKLLVISRKKYWNGTSLLIEIIPVQEELSNLTKEIMFEQFICHKINTPLNHLILPVQLLRTFELPADVEDLCEVIEDAAKEINNKVRDVINYLSAYDCNLGKELSISYRNFENIIREFASQNNNVRLHFNIPNKNFVLKITKEVIEIVLTELMENSTKHSDNKDLKITINILTEDNTKLKLFFADNGKGLKKEDFEKALKSYTQLEKYQTGNKPGMGLGLTKIKELLKFYQSTLHYSNQRLSTGLIVLLTFQCIIDD